jgi:hypothetical protein
LAEAACLLSIGGDCDSHEHNTFLLFGFICREAGKQK